MLEQKTHSTNNHNHNQLQPCNIAFQDPEINGSPTSNHIIPHIYQPLKYLIIIYPNLLYIEIERTWATACGQLIGLPPSHRKQICFNKRTLGCLLKTSKAKSPDVNSSMSFSFYRLRALLTPLTSLGVPDNAMGFSKSELLLPRCSSTSSFDTGCLGIQGSVMADPSNFSLLVF